VTARAGRSAPRSPGATLRGPRSYTTTRGTTCSIAAAHRAGRLAEDGSRPSFWPRTTPISSP